MIKRCASTLCCCGQVDDDDDDESETETHSRVRSTDEISTTDMTEDTSEKDRVDGLVRRKTNTTEESLTKSMLELQKVNERLFEEMKELKAQVLSGRGVNDQAHEPGTEPEEDEEGVGSHQMKSKGRRLRKGGTTNQTKSSDGYWVAREVRKSNRRSYRSTRFGDR